jgi:hypothetical protein
MSMDLQSLTNIVGEAHWWVSEKKRGYRWFDLSMKGDNVTLKLEETDGTNSRISTIGFRAECPVTLADVRNAIHDPVNRW